MIDYNNLNSIFSSRIKRRSLIIGAGALSGLAIASQFSNTRAIAQVKFGNYPFTLGVASGEPYPTSVVIWTRLAPEPLNGGGMPAVNVPVQWQVATDANMKNIVAKGTEIAIPELAHKNFAERHGSHLASDSGGSANGKFICRQYYP
jgi:alkaline phosphatase D